MENKPNHFCGQCGQGFFSEAEYQVHVCPVTGVPPTDPKTMGPEFQAIQQAALDRGKANSQ